MNTGFAISQYPDAAEINRKLNELIKKPIYTITPEALAAYERDYFDAKCSKSKEMIEKAKQIIPGGVQHNLAFNYPFPLVFTKADGCFLYDLDGNRYYDFLQAGGPTVLGSNPPEVREQVIELLNTCGPSTGLFHEFEYKLAKKISDSMETIDMFRMLQSGTEGCMLAARIARLATKKRNIVKMGGAYHGWSDQAIGPESGSRPVDINFCKGVERLCRKYGALLIFDEVVTGFRIGMAGAQGYFGCSPDLTVFGKVIAGGYPGAGGVGGKREYMKYLGAGLDGAVKVKKAFCGGTLSANPLSCAAGYYTLEAIDRENACQKAGEMGDRITKGLNDIIAKRHLPFVAFNQGSICHLETVGTLQFSIDWSKPWTIPGVLSATNERKTEMTHMGAAYMAEGLVTLAGSRLYTSAAYTPEFIDDALARFDKVFANIAVKEN